jgi:GrpB-like predicted nucleotidyltransferase (UPF0157 family)
MVAGFKKYIFRKYLENSPRLFKREKIKLKKILPKDARIEHCGSSAVPGLGGKGIIDIFISVCLKDVRKSKEMLQKAGYSLNSDLGGRDRVFFERDYITDGRTRRVHLHLTHHNSFQIRKAVALVRYMRKYPESAKEYAQIKKEAVRYAKGSGEKYRQYKKAFVERLGRMALKEFSGKK